MPSRNRRDHRDRKRVAGPTYSDTAATRTEPGFDGNLGHKTIAAVPPMTEETRMKAVQACAYQELHVRQRPTGEWLEIMSMLGILEEGGITNG